MSRKEQWSAERPDKLDIEPMGRLEIEPAEVLHMAPAEALHMTPAEPIESVSDADQGQPDYILSDDDIRDLTWDDIWFSQQDPAGTSGLEVEQYCGFWAVAAEVAKATAAGAVSLTNGQARALYAMRAFYFLGMQRGAEAYRRCVAARNAVEDRFCTMAFELEMETTEDFAADLNELPPELFNRLTAMLGLSVPWAAEKGGDGA